MAQEAWIECVPNFSEGRRKPVVEAIVNALRGIPDTHVLDLELDADHNRSVLTFVAKPSAVVQAGLALVGKALEVLDLNHHTGQHPRMGACDVFPMIPLSGVGIEPCVKLCEELGSALADRYSLPVYLYEEAAKTPERRALGDIRKSGSLVEGGPKVGAFEWLRQNIPDDSTRWPDFGPRHVHPTGGCTAVGTRFFLVAYNVNLETLDLRVAKDIADSIREIRGGFPKLRALGFELADQKCVQVSMNVVDYRRTNIDHAYLEIERQAAALGVKVRESEIVGVIPQDAVDRAFQGFCRLAELPKSMIQPGAAPFHARWQVLAPNTSVSEIAVNLPGPEIAAHVRAEFDRLESRPATEIRPGQLLAPVGELTVRRAFQDFIRLPQFPAKQILEERVREVTSGAMAGTIVPEDPILNLRPFLRDLASDQPTPGGGSVAALAAALGAALGEMVSNLTIGKKKYAAVRDQVVAIVAQLKIKREQAFKLIAEDIAAFDDVSAASKKPKDTEDQQRVRHTALQAALKIAAEVPLRCAELALGILKDIEQLAPIGNTNAVSDCAVGALMGLAAVQGALVNVRINLAHIDDKAFVEKMSLKVRDIGTAAARAQAATLAVVDRTISGPTA